VPVRTDQEIGAPADPASDRGGGIQMRPLGRSVLHCDNVEMNRSRWFWRHEKRVCPGYEAAEQWLKQHALLR
jgi:predicted metal-dependent hydrolase